MIKRQYETVNDLQIVMTVYTAGILYCFARTFSLNFLYIFLSIETNISENGKLVPILT